MSACVVRTATRSPRPWARCRSINGTAALKRVEKCNRVGFSEVSISTTFIRIPRALLVCLDVIAALVAHPAADGAPVEVAIRTDVLERRLNACFHVAQTTDIDMRHVAPEQFGEVGTTLSHTILYVF